MIYSRNGRKSCEGSPSSDEGSCDGRVHDVAGMASCVGSHVLMQGSCESRECDVAGMAKKW